MSNKPNINNLTNTDEVKRTLLEKHIPANTVSIIEKALSRGIRFRRPEDLGLLNISPSDIGAITEAVGFGTLEIKNLKRIEYTFKPENEKENLVGYQLVVRHTNNDKFTIEESYPIEDSRRVFVDLDLNKILDKSSISLQVKSATGGYVPVTLSGQNTTDEVITISKEDLVRDTNNAATVTVRIEKIELQNVQPVTGSYRIKGKIISNRSEAKLDGFQVVIFASTVDAEENGSMPPVAFARTETNGYFVTNFLLFEQPLDIDNVKAAKATVTKDDFSKEFPIKLVEKTVTFFETNSDGVSVEKEVNLTTIPERLIFVINEDASEDDEECKGCGCSDLNFHEKKVLEEYSYYTVVRTTEPAIIADVLEKENPINLKEIYGIDINVPFKVFKKFHAIESRQSKLANIANISAVTTTNLTADAITPSTPFLTRELPANDIPGRATNTTTIIERKNIFNKALLDQLLSQHKAEIIIKGNEKPVFKGRTYLSQMNQIDWDDEPTIYQAASIAHGHLLHFKQEWIPDGYSIGDLVYSLPLAPGQKKQIAVLDWERRESAANSQFLEYEETLNNTLIRDRDISEVVSGTLTENIRGKSNASTGGIGFGFGAALMGVFDGGSFGSLLGISGGKSSSSASASQSANRATTANSLQSISDRTMQSASVVRSQRATVVQTVSQGERVQATAESVANYNHCHAITIQYFEVLRHFAVRNRLAGVQECLFVPLQMTPFTIDKCLRWRNTLEKHLLRRNLRGAFDAVTRIQNEKESAFENYYDSIGFPKKHFAEQPVKFFTGELLIEFVFFNTNEGKIDNDILEFYKRFFGISLEQFRDRFITDEELAQNVGPRAIEHLLDAFTIETNTGIDLKIDLTLVSSFRQRVPLQITLRQSSQTPTNIPRENIRSLNIRLNLEKIAATERDTFKELQNKYMKIRVRSGNLRYRTESMTGTLFNGRLDNDIFAGSSDGVYIPTDLTKEELRNPRGEDVDLANNLIHHLNENLEFYHKCIFFEMTPERRFMLLDGIIAPGNANGRSVASVVENRVIGIAGNSLIMPVAPGYQLDPTIDDKFDLFAQYYTEETEPMRISMPTKGIYAEAVMGKCNSCEEKDESRFWRWEESPIPDSPNTQILPINTDTRRADPGNLQAKDFPNPVVNIQNAPNVPDPAGVKAALDLLGKGDAFRDLTGLNQTQLNALATFQKTMDTAQAFGKEAAELAKAAAAMKLVEDAQRKGTISNEQAKEKAGKAIDASIPKSEEEKLQNAQNKLDAIKSALDSGIINDELANSLSGGVLKELSNADDSLSKSDINDIVSTAGNNAADVLFEKGSGDKLEVKPERRLEKLFRNPEDELISEEFGNIGTGSPVIGFPANIASRIKTFNHNVVEFFDLASGTFKTGNVALEPAIMNPAFIDLTTGKAIKNDPLNTTLNDLMKQGSLKAYKNHIRLAVADLSGSKLIKPDFAGYKETENIPGGSTCKIAVLYAAYQLRCDINLFLQANTSIQKMDDLVSSLTAEWESNGITQKFHPKVDEMFEFTAGSPSTVNFSTKQVSVIANERSKNFSVADALKNISGLPKTDGSYNHEAALLVQKVGFTFIGSVMWRSGLFHPKSGGLWEKKVYGNNISWSNNPVPGTKSHNISALSVASYFTLLAQQRLVSRTAAAEIESNLKTGGCLDGMSSANLRFTKCGIEAGGYIHNAVLYDDGSKRAAIVILSKDVKNHQPIFDEIIGIL